MHGWFCDGAIEPTRGKRMHQFFVKSDQVRQDRIRIEGKDVNHIKNVLRMKMGEQLIIKDDKEVEYLCEIESLDLDAVCLKVLQTNTVSRELPVEMYLFQALPKADKMELIIEKAVELGVHAVIPVESRRCIVKLDAKKAAAKVKRWNAIAESAAKQSKRSIIPKVHPVMPFREAVALAKDFQAVCIPYEQAADMESFQEYMDKIKPGIKQAGFFVGPEGGFETEEIDLAREAGIPAVSLGSRILRTETAGLAVLSAVMLKLECESKRQ